MSELRQDRMTGGWVVIAPERGVRPRDALKLGTAPDLRSGFNSECPFCPGHEAQLPHILAEIPSARPPGWQTRVVPNKYPLVQPLPGAVMPVGGSHASQCGAGHHELVIETPRHDGDLVDMSEAEIGTVIAVYQKRFRGLTATPGIRTVVLFRNRGTAAGASLRHPHAQLVALRIVPPRLRSSAIWARQCAVETSQCVTCTELEFEAADGRRIIEETRSFLAFIPFAAAMPCEVWLVPRRHQSSFASLDDANTTEFGLLLRNTLRRLAAAHDDPPYNFVVDSFDGAAEGARFLHWRLRIVPDLVTWGGFELGAGMPINPSSPEDDAERLRAIDPNGRAFSWPHR